MRVAAIWAMVSSMSSEIGFTRSPYRGRSRAAVRSDGLDAEAMTLSKWVLVVLFGVLTHFGASYLVPLEVKDQGAFGGLLRWVWPWGWGTAASDPSLIAPARMASGIGPTTSATGRTYVSVQRHLQEVEDQA
jgi:hypothetical protein